MFSELSKVLEERAEREQRLQEIENRLQEEKQRAEFATAEYSLELSGIRAAGKLINILAPCASVTLRRVSTSVVETKARCRDTESGEWM